MRRNFFPLLWLIVPASVWAQHLSIGVTGGAGLTDAFMDQTLANSEASFHSYSATKDYAVGPAIELQLPFNLAVEFDALYRPLQLTDQEITYSIRTSVIYLRARSTPGTPLARKVPSSGPLRWIQPFVEAGPSFRHAGTCALLMGNSLSDHGFAAGAGGEIHIWKLRIAPEIRYTRWGADTPSNPILLPAFRAPTSNVNQAELLVGF